MWTARSLSGLLLALCLLSGVTALAANERRHKPSEYQEVTDEDRAAARERSRNKVGQWRETELPPEYKFPWMQVGFTVLTLGLAIPIGWAAYNRFSRELRERELVVAAPRKRAKAADVEE